MNSLSASVAEYIASQDRLGWRRAVLRWIGATFIMPFIRLTVHNLSRIPTSGPTILMINHISFLDPVITTLAVTQRDVVAMAKAETLNSWASRVVVQNWGAITVQRDEVDRSALMKAIALLKSGRLLLIAPEGTRHPEGLSTPKDGIAYMVAKAEAVVVPVAFTGGQHWMRDLRQWRRPVVDMHIGRPFRFRVDGRLTQEGRTELMREAMYQLALTIPDAHADLRGRYSDVENATTELIEFTN